MFQCFAVEKDPGMLVFFTDCDMSGRWEREALEKNLTERTGVKCVVIDLLDTPPSLRTEYNTDYIREFLEKDAKERREESRCQRTDDRKFNLKTMLAAFLGCFLGGLLAVLLKL